MSDPEQSALERQVREGEVWLQQYVDCRADAPAPDLEALKDRTRREVVDVPESRMPLPPSPELLARIKQRVRAELVEEGGIASARASRPRGTRRIRGFLAGGLAAAAALMLVVWVGERPDQPAASLRPEVSTLNDFAVVVEGSEALDDAAELVDSTADTAQRAEGYLPDDPWFEGEVDALDEEMDRLLTDTWISDDLG